LVAWGESNLYLKSRSPRLGNLGCHGSIARMAGWSNAGKYRPRGGHPEECSIPHDSAGPTEECRGMHLTRTVT